MKDQYGCIELLSNNAKKVEILFDGIIGSSFFEEGITLKWLAKEIDSAGEIDEIHILMNSPGGLAYEGMAIYNYLARHDAKVIMHILGIAASAASLVSMAGDEIIAYEVSEVMIHNARVLAIGDKQIMKIVLDRLEQLDSLMAIAYSARTGESKDQISKMMDAQTFMTAAEAKEKGFVDSVAPAKAMPKKVEPKSYADSKEQIATLFTKWVDAMQKEGSAGPAEFDHTYRIAAAQIKGDTVFTTEPSEWISVSQAQASRPYELLAKCTNKNGSVNVNALRAILTMPKWANQELVTRSLNEFKRQQVESSAGLLPSTIDAMPIAIRIGGDTHLIQRKDLAMTQEIVTVLGVENYEKALEKAKQLMAAGLNAGGGNGEGQDGGNDQSEVLKRMENAITSLTKQIKDMSDTQIEAGKASMEAELEALYVGGYFNEAQRKSLTALFEISPEAYRVSVDAMKLGGVNPKLAELRNAEGSGGDGKPATKEKDPDKRLQARLEEIKEEMGDKYTVTAGYERIKKEDPKLLEDYTKASTSVSAPQS